MVEISTTFLAAIISTIIAVTMASIFFCCWPKKRSAELGVKKSAKEDVAKDRSRSTTPANGKSEVADNKSASGCDMRLPLLSSRGMLDSNDGIGDFSAVQREQEILRPFIKPPPPKKKAKKSRAPRLLQNARDSQDIFAELIEDDSRDSSDKENIDSPDEPDSAFRRSHSQDKEKTPRSSALAETEQTRAVSMWPTALLSELTKKDDNRNQGDEAKAQSVSTTGKESPKISPIARPRKGPAVSPKPTPKARSKPTASSNPETSLGTVESEHVKSSFDSKVDSLGSPDNILEVSSHPPQPFISQTNAEPSTEPSKETISALETTSNTETITAPEATSNTETTTAPEATSNTETTTAPEATSNTETVTAPEATSNTETITENELLHPSLEKTQPEPLSHDTVSNPTLQQDEKSEASDSSDINSSSETTDTLGTAGYKQTDTTDSAVNEDSISNTDTNAAAKNEDEEANSGENEKSERQITTSAGEETFVSTCTQVLQSGTDKSQPSSLTTESETPPGQASHQGGDVSRSPCDENGQQLKESDEGQEDKTKTSKIPVRAGSKARPSSPKTPSDSENVSSPTTT